MELGDEVPETLFWCKKLFIYTLLFCVARNSFSLVCFLGLFLGLGWNHSTKKTLFGNKKFVETSVMYGARLILNGLFFLFNEGGFFGIG